MVKRIEGGLDLGGTGFLHRDKTALVIIQRVDSRIKILKVLTWDTMNEDTLKEVGKLCTDYGVAILKIDAAQDYKDDLANYFKKDRIYPINFKMYKEIMLGQMNRKIERRLYEIAETETELILQMKLYKKGGRPHNDDLVDALMLATFYDEKLFNPNPQKNKKEFCISPMRHAYSLENIDRQPNDQDMHNWLEEYREHNYEDVKQTGVFCKNCKRLIKGEVNSQRYHCRACGFKYRG